MNEHDLTTEEWEALKRLLKSDADIIALLKADQRRQWLLSSIKAVSLWLAALGAAWVSTKTLIAELLSKGG